MKSKRYLNFAWGLLGSMVLAPLAWADDSEPANSGFLGDDEVYSRLEKVEIRDGREAYRWIGPKLNFANYKTILIDEVLLYPEPQPNEQISAETLDEISAYLTERLTTKVAAVVNVTDSPGPEVVRIQVAITGVEIKTEGMKAYEVIPVAAVFGAARAATGTRKRDVFVRGEARFVDSVTGELVGAAVRRVEGEELKGKRDQLALEHVQGNLDSATDDASILVGDMFSESQ